MHDPFTEWLSEDFIKTINVTYLEQQFRTAEPFAHLEFENFLNEEKIQTLKKAVNTLTFHEKDSDLFHFHQTNDLKTTKNPHLKEFVSFLMSHAFVHLMRDITGITLSEDIIDIHATKYQDTDFLLCHDDKLQGRKIAFLFYLIDLEKGEGGALELYNQEDDQPTKVAKRIIPKAGTFVFFEVAPNSFHSVSELLIHEDRIALAGWYYG